MNIDHHRWPSAALLIAALFLALPAQMQAYTWWQCNGDPTVWQGSTADTYQIMRCSIPQGSQRAADVLDGFGQWNAVYGMWDVFSWTWGTTACVNVNHGNGVNQIFFGTDAGLDGAFGVTWVRYDSSCFWWFSDQHIEEADIGINGEVAFEWGNPPCNTYTPGTVGSRTTIVHEMGHALGLLHDDRFMNLMMTNDGEGKYCGTYVIEPHPDDAQGGRFLYSSGNTSVDLGASEFRFVGLNNVALNTTPGTTFVCPGDSYTFRWSVGNLGTVGRQYDVRWYLSTNDYISNYDIYVAGNVNAYESAGGFDTWSRTVTIPASVAYDTEYFLGTYIDWNGNISERYETNNRTYMARKIRVRTAASCP